MDSKYISEQLISFIEQCPSCFHTIHTVTECLKEHGCIQLSECEPWNLKEGHSYVVTRNNSSLIAFTIPEQGIQKYHIVATHSDFPSFKIKEHPDMNVENQYVKLNIEKYGGMIQSPWFDRPLSVAGRVITNSDSGLKEHLVNVDRDLVLIPNLAIHLNRELNDGYKYNVQKDLLPLLGTYDENTSFLKQITDSLPDTEPSDVLGYDLFLYNRQRGTIWGAKEEFISAPRLDDLQCTFSALHGYLTGAKKEAASLLCIFDNEEVGSSTRQGAASTFLTDTIERIQWSLGMNKEEAQIALAKSFMISADNGHALHPNYPEKSDPVNRPCLNQGILIKYNGNQKYCTDALTASYFKNLCSKANVPYQIYTNRSDIAGGSTLGNISSCQYAVSAVDIGLPQLAMHSPYETAGVKDTAYLIQALTCFYA